MIRGSAVIIVPSELRICGLSFLISMTKSSWVSGLCGRGCSQFLLLLEVQLLKLNLKKVERDEVGRIVMTYDNLDTLTVGIIWCIRFLIGAYLLLSKSAELVCWWDFIRCSISKSWTTECLFFVSSESRIINDCIMWIQHRKHILVLFCFLTVLFVCGLVYYEYVWMT